MGVMSELVEEIDHHGKVVRIVTRSQMRAEVLRHRCTYVIVRRPSDGAVLVHRRAVWKDQWPDRWDLAFGGVCGVDEDWEQSARRELAEEAGVDAAAMDVELVDLGAVEFEGDVRVLGRVYEVSTDGPFTFTDGEVQGVQWVPVDELGQWLDDHVVCDDSLEIVPPLVRDR